MSMSRAANLIRETRVSAGLTQAQLASRMGTTQSAVARLEARGANPRMRTIEEAVRASGRQLEMASKLPDVDEHQILRHLALSPADRLRTFETSRENLRDLLHKARWPDR